MSQTLKKTNKDFFWNKMLGTFGEMNILMLNAYPVMY